MTSGACTTGRTTRRVARRMRGRLFVWASAGVTVDASRANSTNSPMLRRDAELTNFDFILKASILLLAPKSHNLWRAVWSLAMGVPDLPSKAQNGDRQLFT